MNITILGAGAWGSALAINLSARHHVTLWAYDAAQIEAMRATGYNQRYLPEIPLPPDLNLTADLHAAFTGAELILVAVPIAALRATLQQIAAIPIPIPVIWACKGFEAGTTQLPHQVAAETLPKNFICGVLSGPSFALEVARGLPTTLILASSDEEFAKQVAQSLHHSSLRIYSSTDVMGVEVGGAVKNVLAIAAGIAEGMGYGQNARAGLITRGLAEMTRLGLKMGVRAETLSGLSGAGDLILTCTGDLSRNRQVGILLAQQQALPDILSQLGHVAEGVYTVREVHHLAQRLGVDMPICAAVYSVLYEQVPAANAVEALLNRAPNSEFNSPLPG
ncbi:MAG: NAD(P)H-dependent glycerol-3-phosphate dehydrogenase [Candidatus Nitrotoga sp.]